VLPTLVLTLAAGLAIGSFLNVVAWRLPRGESLVAPGSHCPGCAAPVRPSDNVPVVSWLLLRGRCRDCGTGIGARYPLVEAATAALWVAVVAVAWGDPARIVLGLALVTLMVPVVLIDLDHRLIPNRLTGPFAVLAVALGLLLDPGFVPEQLAAGAAAGGFFLAAALLHPQGMGHGRREARRGDGGSTSAAPWRPRSWSAWSPGVLVGAMVMARLGVARVAGPPCRSGRSSPWAPWPRSSRASPQWTST
jgi:leader peptidase (prepilin peptidase)/N-methyltransferase